MTTSTLLLIVLAFLAVTTWATNIEGVSRLCEEARLHPYHYGPIPVECCDDRGGCDKYIKPNETKYGLYNPDQKWTKRLCSCDQALLDCIVKKKVGKAKILYRQKVFAHRKCIREKWSQATGTSDLEEYEIVPFGEIIPRPGESR